MISRPARRSDSDASSAVKIFDSYRKAGSQRQTCSVNSPYYCEGDPGSALCCTVDFPACCPADIGGCCTSTRPFCCADGDSCCRAGYKCCPGPDGDVTHCCRSDTRCCGTTCCQSSRAIAVTAMAAIGWLMVISVHISIMY